ncbi:hypothetical protein [Streptomyces spinoverrucosus]|uniref:hypothetical protein n=1 Tax=Streptomyces spinoverrucosus TaxID=284043 RepID=UPI00142EA64F|nr:hypothetical protein [Streptomyces spinoverrucosus]
MNTNTKNGGASSRARGMLRAAGRGLVLAVVSLPPAVLCLTFSAVSIALIRSPRIWW